MSDEKAFGGEPLKNVMQYNSIAMRVSIDEWADTYEMQPLFTSKFTDALAKEFDYKALGVADPGKVQVLPDEPVKVERKPLREYLLESFSEDAVDAYMLRRAASEARWEARKRWEKSWRGRTVLVWREVRSRVRGAWDVLRHGIVDDY